MHSTVERGSRYVQICGLIALLWSVLVPTATAQQEPSSPTYPYQLIGVAGIGASIHSPNFSAIPGIPSANSPYRSQVGPMALLGGGVAKRFSPLFSASVLLHGSYLSGSVISDESTVLSINDAPVPATIRHTIDLSLFAISIEPSMRLLAGPLRLRLGLPLQIMLNGSYVATQQVVNPPGVYLGGQTVRVESEGTLPGLQRFVPALSVGFGTTGKEIGGVRIEPEITLRIPISSISSAADWTIWSVSAGVRVAPLFDKIRPVKRDTLWIRDTTVVEVAATDISSTSTNIFAVDSVDDVGDEVILRHVALRERTTINVPREPVLIRAEARAMFVDQQGVERERISIRTVKYDNEFMMPLMSTVYFAPRSHDLTSYDARPVSVPQPWDSGPIARRIAAMQFRLLDDWAKEIARSTVVTVRGRASSTEDPVLADRRATAVVNYLIGHGAPRSKIRVLDTEILDDSSSIARTVTIDPGKAQTTMQREFWSTVQPEACSLRIHLRAEGDAPVRSWEVAFSTKSGSIGTVGGEGGLPENILFTVPNSVLMSIGSGSEIYYRVLVHGDDSTSFVSEPARISLQQVPYEGSTRTKRYMAIPTTELRSAHDAAFHTLKWGKTEVLDLTAEELEMLHSYGATWARIVNGMMIVWSDQ